MQEQKTAASNYFVFDQQSQQKIHSGTLEACTEYIRTYGLGWVFLEIHDIKPVKKMAQTVKMLNPQM